MFPPGVKAGEGHYGWDLRKGSMMTNGTVGKVTAGAKGRELDVTYPNGERKIIVPSGGLASNGIAIGENGAKPPM